MQTKIHDYIIGTIALAIVLIILWNINITSKVNELSSMVDSIIKRPVVTTPAGKMGGEPYPEGCDGAKPGEITTICDYDLCSFSIVECIDGSWWQIGYGICNLGTSCKPGDTGPVIGPCKDDPDSTCGITTTTSTTISSTTTISGDSCAGWTGCTVDSCTGICTVTREDPCQYQIDFCHLEDKSKPYPHKECIMANSYTGPCGSYPPSG